MIESTMPGFLNDLLKSRRFWVSVGGLAAVLLRDRLNLPFTDEQITDIALLIGAWVVGESLRSSSLKESK